MNVNAPTPLDAATNDMTAAANVSVASSDVTFPSGLSWTRFRVPRLLSRLGKVCFFLGAFGMFSMLLPYSALFGLASLIGVLAWPLFIVSYILSLTQTSFAGALTASKHGLVVVTRRDRSVIPTAKIAGALVVERMVAGGLISSVEIELTSGDRLTARMPDPNAPRAVVDALGFGSGGRRVHVTLAKSTRRLLHPLFAFASYAAALTLLMLGATSLRAGDGFELAFLAYPPVTLLFYALLQRFVRPPEVTVGDDGIAVRVHGKTRVVARRDIAFVANPPGGVVAIEERGGKRVAITGVMLDHARLAAVARLITERAGPQEATGDRFAHYDRAGRPLAAWREHLAHAMNDTSYRRNAATVDEAASVLRSAHATAEQRVGAALALRVAGQPRERVRVAIEGAVDDRVRGALEAVADADDDVVIEEALKRLAL